MRVSAQPGMPRTVLLLVRLRQPIVLAVVVAALGAGTSAQADAPGRWVPPVTVSPPGTAPARPTATMNLRGDAVVTWHAGPSSSSKFSLGARVKPVGREWAPAFDSGPLDHLELWDTAMGDGGDTTFIAFSSPRLQV